MDRLSDIPVKNTSITPEESKLLETFFGDASSSNGGGNSSSHMDEEKISWRRTFKISLYSGIVFAALANPWINVLLARFPYITGNPIMIFVLKIFLFILITMMVIKFVM
jgi:hypothetical protein